MSALVSSFFLPLRAVLQRQDGLSALAIPGFFRLVFTVAFTGTHAEFRLFAVVHGFLEVVVFRLLLRDRSGYGFRSGCQNLACRLDIEIGVHREMCSKRLAARRLGVALDTLHTRTFLHAGVGGSSSGGSF